MTSRVLVCRAQIAYSIAGLAPFTGEVQRICPAQKTPICNAFRRCVQVVKAFRVDADESAQGYRILSPD